MKALWVGTVWPSPLDTGGRLRARQTLAALAEVADHVTAIGLAPPGEGAAALRAALPAVDVREPVPWEVRIRRRPRQMARALAVAATSGQCYRTAKFDAPALAGQIAELAESFDLIYVSYFGTMAAVDRARRAVGDLPPMILDTQNIEYMVASDAAEAASGRWVAMRPLLREEARRTERAESRACREAASVVAIGSHDATVIERWGGRPVIVPPVAWPLVPRHRPGTDVVVLGNLGWPPTAEGLGAMLPSLARMTTTAGRVVVGAGASAAMRASIASAGLEYLGYVEDVEPIWARAGVLVVPGGGTGARMRFLEAFRRGVPVVATEAAIEGLDPDGAVLVVSDAADIGQAVERVLGDDRLAEDLATAGARVASTTYHPDRAREGIARAVSLALA